MGFLDRLLGRREAEPPRGAESSQPGCPHVTLVPNWDMAEDMGDLEKVSRYTCEACGAGFSREEGDQLRAELRAKGAERIRQIGAAADSWEERKAAMERERQKRSERDR